MGIIKLRLTGTGNDRKKVASLIEEQVNRLYSTIPEFIYGEDENLWNSV